MHAVDHCLGPAPCEWKMGVENGSGKNEQSSEAVATCPRIVSRLPLARIRAEQSADRYRQYGRVGCQFQCERTCFIRRGSIFVVRSAFFVGHPSSERKDGHPIQFDHCRVRRSRCAVSRRGRCMQLAMRRARDGRRPGGRSPCALHISSSSFPGHRDCAGGHCA